LSRIQTRIGWLRLEAIPYVVRSASLPRLTASSQAAMDAMT
jgi:hypothetical protein